MSSKIEELRVSRALPVAAHPAGRASAPSLPNLRRPAVVGARWSRTLHDVSIWALSAWVSVPALLLVALALRVWHYTDIPRYADEINEIMPAFAIVRGESFPLTSGPKHIGAGFDYLLAAVFLVFGRSPDLPRLVLVVSGLATVLLVYGYARSLRGHGAGLMAAGLLAVSAPHVLLSSRVAWSVSLTPLLLTGAAWTLDLAVTQRRPRWIMATGLLAGLALQAHPSVGSIVLGLGIFVLLRGRHLFGGPEAYLGAALGVLGCANVLAYNWQSGVGGLRSVTQQYPGEAVGFAAYAANALAPWHGFLLTLASAVDPSQPPSALHPFVLLVATIGGAGLIYTAWRVSLLPLAAVTLTLLVLPLLHDDFEPLLKARYVMPLVPLTFVAVGVLGVDAAARLRAGRWPVLVVWLAMASGMLVSLQRFEAAVVAADCTNAPQRAFVEALGQRQLAGEWVLLDEGSVRSAERVGYLTMLELSHARVGEARLLRGGVWTELAERSSFLTAVDDGKAAMVFEKQGLPLLMSADLAAVNPGQGSGIGLYRVTRTGATLLYHDASPGCGTLRTN